MINFLSQNTDSKFLASLLEVLASFLTLCFGLYGAFNDTKPKDGKLSLKGKIAVIGLIVSGLISVTIKSVLAYNTKKELERAEGNREEQIKYMKDILFKDSVNSQLRASLLSLDSLTIKSDTTIAKANLGLDLQNRNLKKQGIILKNTQRSINPLFPFNLAISYKISTKNFDPLGYISMIRNLKDSIDRKLISAVTLLFNDEIKKKQEEVIRSYYITHKIVVGYKDDLVTSISVLDTSSYLYPDIGSSEYNYFNNKILLIITRNDGRPLIRIPTISTFGSLKGIHFSNYYHLKDPVTTQGFRIDFNKGTEITIFYKITNPTIYNSDNSLISLQDIENSYVVLQDPSESIQSLELYSGFSFNQVSSFKFKDDKQDNGYRIHLITQKELGIAK